MSSIGAPVEMTRQALAANAIITQTGVEVMAAQRGAFRGEAVEIVDEGSKLADMKEEIGNAFTSHKPSHLKSMEVKAGQGANLEAIKRITEYLDTLPDLPHGDKLEQLVKKFEQFIDLMQQRLSGGGGGGTVTVDDILKALQDYDGDVTHQFAALDGMLQAYDTATAERGGQKAATEAAKSFVELLKEAQVQYARTDTARDVRAGFAMAVPAHDLAPTLETNPAALRESFREMLRRKPVRLGKVFGALAQYDLSKGFLETVDALVTAARTDLDGAHPMLDKEQLHELLDELSKMKQMKSAYDGARDQVRLVGRLLGQEDRGKLDAGSLTAAMLDFADLPTASLGDARKLLLGIGQSEPAAQVNMGNAVHELHGQLPDAVFASTAARLQQGETLDLFLNELSATEEASYAASEGD